MAVEHKDLTGTQLHEPKGAATAPAGSVYVANGAGSGSWLDRNTGNLLYNEYFLQDQMEDVSSITSVYFYIPVKSEMTRFSAVLHGATDGADKTLSVYINGVAFADSLVIPTTGTAAGSKYNTIISTMNTLNVGDIVEIRSNGSSATTRRATIQLGLRAKV